MLLNNKYFFVDSGKMVESNQYKTFGVKDYVYKMRTPNKVIKTGIMER